MNPTSAKQVIADAQKAAKEAAKKARQQAEQAAEAARKSSMRTRLLGGGAVAALLIGGLLVFGGEDAEQHVEKATPAKQDFVKPQAQPAPAPEASTPSSGADELSFDEAAVSEEVVEDVVVVEPVEMIPGWRVQALGHPVGALPFEPLYMSKTVEQIRAQPALLNEVDVAAGLEHVTGQLAAWNSAKINVGDPHYLIADEAPATAADAKADLQALMSALQAGESAPAKGAAAAMVKIDKSSMDYSVFSIIADGEIEVAASGVYEFRAVGRRRENRINRTNGPDYADRESDSWGFYTNNRRDVAIEVAGQLAYGGATAQEDKTRNAKWLVPEPVRLEAGSYPIHLRIAPDFDNNWGGNSGDYIWGANTRDWQVEYRHIGVEGWKPVTDIMRSKKVAKGDLDRAPIDREAVQVTRAHAYDPKCDYSTTTDAFVNPTATTGVDVTVPIKQCQLTTVDLKIQAPEPGDYFVLPYVDSQFCVTAATYLDQSTSTAKLMMPSPAVHDYGYSHVSSGYSDAYGHIRVKQAGDVEVTVKVMCRANADLSMFVKTPSSAKMLPW